MAARPALVIVGRLVRPHGVRGEIRVDPDTDFPERLGTLQQAILVREEESTPVRLEAVRAAGHAFLVKIAGIDTPEEAGRWRGAYLAIPQEHAAPLPPDRHYVFDVLGMLVETEEGREVGTISEVLRTAANDVYVVRGAGAREALIPAISSVVVHVDMAERRMVIRPLPGMLEEA